MNSYYDSSDYVDQTPPLVVNLNRSLTSFEADVSPWKEPSKWIEADEMDIELIVQRAIDSLANEEIREASFAGQVMVYPVSSAYTKDNQTRNLTPYDIALDRIHFYTSHSLAAQ